MYNWILVDAVKHWLSIRPYGRMILAIVTGLVFTMIVIALFPDSEHPAAVLVHGLISLLLPSTIAVVTYHNLLRRFGIRLKDGEIHCRKCDYILRGIAEPRCPECGEQI